MFCFAAWTLADWRSILDPLLLPEPSSAVAAKLAASKAEQGREAHTHHSHSRKHHLGRKHHGKRHHHSRDAAEPKKPAGCLKQRGLAARMFVQAGTTCPAGEPACVFLPGKQECCFPGEMCIPNVGCRC